MYIGLFIIKVIDNILGTIKSIATYKEKKILSSVLVVISQLIFYLVVSQVINDSSILAILIVSVSSGIGNYLAFLINDKFRKDVKWVMLFTSNNVEKSKEFSDYLKQCKIKNVVNKGYDPSWENAISIIIFSKNKEESRLINSYLQNNDFKYLLEVI
jgi:uncharacterized protein YebE (UPF0316 family)